MAQKEALAEQLNAEVREPWRYWTDGVIRAKLPKCAEAKEGQSK